MSVDKEKYDAARIIVSDEYSQDLEAIVKKANTAKDLNIDYSKGWLSSHELLMLSGGNTYDKMYYDINFGADSPWYLNKEYTVVHRVKNTQNYTLNITDWMGKITVSASLLYDATDNYITALHDRCVRPKHFGKTAAKDKTYPGYCLPSLPFAKADSTVYLECPFTLEFSVSIFLVIEIMRVSKDEIRVTLLATDKRDMDTMKDAGMLEERDRNIPSLAVGDSFQYRLSTHSTGTRLRSVFNDLRNSIANIIVNLSTDYHFDVSNSILKASLEQAVRDAVMGIRFRLIPDNGDISPMMDTVVLPRWFFIPLDDAVFNNVNAPAQLFEYNGNKYVTIAMENMTDEYSKLISDKQEDILVEYSLRPPCFFDGINFDNVSITHKALMYMINNYPDELVPKEENIYDITGYNHISVPVKTANGGKVCRRRYQIEKKRYTRSSIALARHCGEKEDMTYITVGSKPPSQVSRLSADLIVNARHSKKNFPRPVSYKEQKRREKAVKDVSLDDIIDVECVNVYQDHDKLSLCYDFETVTDVAGNFYVYMGTIGYISNIRTDPTGPDETTIFEKFIPTLPKGVKHQVSAQEIKLTDGSTKECWSFACWTENRNHIIQGTVTKVIVLILAKLARLSPGNVAIAHNGMGFDNKCIDKALSGLVHTKLERHKSLIMDRKLTMVYSIDPDELSIEIATSGNLSSDDTTALIFSTSEGVSSLKLKTTNQINKLKYERESRKLSGVGTDIIDKEINRLEGILDDKHVGLDEYSPACEYESDAEECSMDTPTKRIRLPLQLRDSFRMTQESLAKFTSVYAPNCTKQEVCLQDIFNRKWDLKSRILSDDEHQTVLSYAIQDAVSLSVAMYNFTTHYYKLYTALATAYSFDKFRPEGKSLISSCSIPNRLLHDIVRAKIYENPVGLIKWFRTNGYFGGLCHPLPGVNLGMIYKNVVGIDIKSSYPAVMHTGVPGMLIGIHKTPPQPSQIGFVLLTINDTDDRFTPMLTKAFDGYLVFAHATRDPNKVSVDIDDNTLSAFTADKKTYLISSEEWFYFQSVGYLKDYKFLAFFEYTKDVSLTKLVNYLYGLKDKASRDATAAKTTTDREYHLSVCAMAKRTLNSIYGAFGLNKEVIRSFPKNKGLLFPQSEEIDGWVYARIIQNDNRVANQVAAWCTAVARLRLYKKINFLLHEGRQPLYCDTDSVYYVDSKASMDVPGQYSWSPPNFSESQHAAIIKSDIEDKIYIQDNKLGIWELDETANHTEFVVYWCKQYGYTNTNKGGAPVIVKAGGWKNIQPKTIEEYADPNWMRQQRASYPKFTWDYGSKNKKNEFPHAETIVKFFDPAAFGRTGGKLNTTITLGLERIKSDVHKNRKKNKSKDEILPIEDDVLFVEAQYV